MGGPLATSILSAPPGFFGGIVPGATEFQALVTFDVPPTSPSTSGGTGEAWGASSAAVAATDTALGNAAGTVGSGAENTALGASSIAGSVANPAKCTAVGKGARATAASSTSLGCNASAGTSNSVAVGQGASATGASDTVVGQNSTTVGTGGTNTAVGHGATAGAAGNPVGCTAIGDSATASAAGTLAVGTLASATASQCTAVGKGASTGGTGISNTAIGHSATAGSGTNGSGTAVGHSSNANGNRSTAIGDNATASLDNCIAIGASATAATLQCMIDSHGVLTRATWALITAALNIVGAIFSQTTEKTIANSAAQSTMIGAGVGTLVLPAGSMIAGRTVRLKLSGIFGTQVTAGNETINFTIGGANKASTPTGAILGALAQTNQGWSLEINLTCLTTGAGGTAHATGSFSASLATFVDQTCGLTETAAFAFDTTVANTLDVKWTWGTAVAANTITTQVCTVEIVN